MVILEANRFRAGMARRHGIGLRDAAVLATLHDLDGAAKPSELAASLYLTSGTLTPILGRLERRKYLSRSPHPDDRRATLVTLRRKGELAVRDAADQIRSASLEVRAAAGEGDHDRMVVLLQCIADVLHTRSNSIGSAQAQAFHDTE